jgi:predicted ATPase
MGSLDSAVGVFGREVEVARIESFLDDLAERPQALIIEGDAGIGKSALWHAGVEAARELGYWVLICRSVQSEAALTFSDLSDLLEPVPEAALAELPPPQRHALDAALLRAAPGPGPPDQRAVSVATLGVVRKLATTAPVVIAVDDWPWLDAASAEVLDYALRRVAVERVGLLATARPDELPERTSSLARSLPAGRFQRLEVGPLALTAFGAMLDTRALHPIRGPELMRLHVAAGGNPLFGLELVAAGDIGDTTARSDRPLAVPASLPPLLRRRLAALPASVRHVVLALAASPRPRVELVVAVTGDSGRAHEALDAAEAAGILEVVDDEIRFAHPLLRSLAYSDATQRQRRRAHGILAAAAGEPEERARHRALAATGPDESLAEELDAAAGAARLRGAALAGCELADLALSLTPSDASPARTGRLLAAGRLHLSAFDLEGARRLLQEAVDSSGPSRERVEALYQLATVARYSEGAVASLVLEQALDESGDSGVLRASLHRDLGIILAASGDPAAAEHYEAALDIAQEAGDGALAAQLMALQAAVGFVTGKGVRRDLIEGALGDRGGTERFAMEARPRVVVSHILQFTDDLAGARALLLEEYEHEAERGAETDLPFLVVYLLELEIWAGNWDLAERYAEEGYAAAIVSGAVTQLAFMRGARALLRACQGRETEARKDAEMAITDAARCGA